MKCPKCRADNPESVKFCGEFGTPLEAHGIRGHEPNSPEFGIVSPNSQPDSLEFGIVSPGLKTETLQIPLHELTSGSTFAGRY